MNPHGSVIGANTAQNKSKCVALPHHIESCNTNQNKNNSVSFSIRKFIVTTFFHSNRLKESDRKRNYYCYIHIYTGYIPTQ